MAAKREEDGTPIIPEKAVAAPVPPDGPATPPAPPEGGEAIPPAIDGQEDSPEPLEQGEQPPLPVGGPVDPPSVTGDKFSVGMNVMSDTVGTTERIEVPSTPDHKADEQITQAADNVGQGMSGPGRGTVNSAEYKHPDDPIDDYDDLADLIDMLPEGAVVLTGTTMIGTVGVNRENPSIDASASDIVPFTLSVHLGSNAEALRPNGGAIDGSYAVEENPDMIPLIPGTSCRVILIPMVKGANSDD